MASDLERAAESLKPDSVSVSGLVITEHFIRKRLGMILVVSFPEFETDAAGVVSHGEELERIGELCGHDNVIASLYFDEGGLLLGIFAREDSIPPGTIPATSSEPVNARHELE